MSRVCGRYCSAWLILYQKVLPRYARRPVAEARNVGRHVRADGGAGHALEETLGPRAVVVLSRRRRAPVVAEQAGLAGVEALLVSLPGSPERRWLSRCSLGLLAKSQNAFKQKVKVNLSNRSKHIQAISQKSCEQ